MAKNNNKQSSLLVSLALPAILVSLYAGYVRMYPTQDQRRIDRLEADVQRVKGSRVPEERLEMTATQIRQKKEELAKLTMKMDSLRSDAAKMIRGKLDSSRQLVIAGKLSRIFDDAGLRLVNDHPGNPQSVSQMLGTLNAATKELGQTLKQLASEESENVPIQLPEDMTFDLNPEEWIAEQRRLRVGNFDGPMTAASEVRLVGNYRSMVKGLEAIIDACPQVVVTSAAFEVPLVKTSGAKPLIWNIRMQMRPVAAPNAPGQSSGVVYRMAKPAITVPDAEFSAAASNGATDTVGLANAVARFRSNQAEVD